MLKPNPNGVPFQRKEKRFKKLLRNGLLLTLILFFATIAINQIQLQNQPQKVIEVINGNTATQTATTTITTTATATQTFTLLTSVNVIVRSPNGTIISNSTG
jgi:ABC-type sulfate transport system permease component